MPKGKYRVIQGDCLELMKSEPSGSVNLIAADPPWGIDWPGYDTYKDDVRDERFVEWGEAWMREAYRVLHRHGSFWLAMGPEFVSEFDVAAKRVGFRKRNQICQYATFGVNCSKNFSRNSHYWLYYTKTKSKFTFNKDDRLLRVPSARQLKYNDKRKNSKGKLPDNVWVIHPDDIQESFGVYEDTWLISRVAGTFKERQQSGTHVGGEDKDERIAACPQMPRIAMDRIIRACSNPGDLVMDPFCGNFTTGASAIALGRNFVGMELSKAYVKAGLKRLEETPFLAIEVDGK